MRSLLNRCTHALVRLRVRLGLSLVGLASLACGIAVLGASVFAFAGVSEDVTRHNGLFRSDGMHLRWFIDHRPETLVHLARVLTDVGNIAGLGLIAVISALILWRRGLPLFLALAPGSALVIGGGLAAIGKSVVGRARPPVSLHLVAESDASFPSGHATDSTALFVTLALVVAVFILHRPLGRLVCVLGSGLLAGSIGASRLVLGVHWPSDVLAGWALGTTAALAVTLTAAVLVRLVPPGPVVPNPRRRERLVYLLARERRSGPLHAV